jgi:hypothetical protein
MGLEHRYPERWGHGRVSSAERDDLLEDPTNVNPFAEIDQLAAIALRDDASALTTGLTTPRLTSKGATGARAEGLAATVSGPNGDGPALNEYVGRDHVGVFNVG